VLSHRDVHISISLRLTGESSLTSAQPLGSRSPVLSHRTSYSTDLYLTASHRRIIWSITSSQLSAQRRPVHRFISVSERTTHPTHGLPHPTQGHTTFHLRLREEPHTHLMGTPNSWASSPHTGAHNVPSPSQRGTTHPSHGHTQLMGSLSGRLTQSVSWRMSHAAVIINNAHKCLMREV
jgi:hypothetical protein